MKGTTPGVSSPDPDTPTNPVGGPASSVRLTPPSESHWAGSSKCRIRQENEPGPVTGSSAASVRPVRKIVRMPELPSRCLANSSLSDRAAAMLFARYLALLEPLGSRAVWSSAAPSQRSFRRCRIRTPSYCQRAPLSSAGLRRSISATAPASAQGSATVQDSVGNSVYWSLMVTSGDVVLSA